MVIFGVFVFRAFPCPLGQSAPQRRPGLGGEFPKLIEAADLACSSLAARNKPSQDLLDNREAQLAAALVVQTVLVTIQEAALEKHHKPRIASAHTRPDRSYPAGRAYRHSCGGH